MTTPNILQYPLKSLALDDRGFPLGHANARLSAIQLGMDMQNELPDTVYHLNATDADWLFGQVILRYLSELEREQAGRDGGGFPVR
jgi:hypothetical protein